MGKKQEISFDTETTGLELFGAHAPFAISACDDQGECFYWRAKSVDPRTRKVHWEQATIRKINRLLGEYKRVSFHNAKFDVRGLAKIGVDLTDRWEDIHDTLPMSHVFNSGEPHGLKPLAVKYLRILDDDEKALRDSIIQARRDAPDDWELGEIEECYWMGDPELCKRYAVQDTVRTMGLRKFYTARFDETPGLWARYEEHRALQPILYQMEESGLYLPGNNLEDELRRCESIRDELAATFPEGLNVNSPIQLGKLLYEEYKLEPRRTESGNYSTKYEVLLDLQAEAEGDAHAMVSNLISFRGFDVACNYLSSYRKHQVDDCIHGSINQTGTRGTRFSMARPNGQNIGKPDDEDPHAPNLRRVFGPRPGYVWVSIDYSQLEGRIMAHLSGDPLLNQIYEEGRDWHTETTWAVFEDTLKALKITRAKPFTKDSREDKIFKGYRKLAKNINFAKQYGGGANAIIRYAEGNRERAVQYSRKYDLAYQGVTAFRKEVQSLCKANGGYVYTAPLLGEELGYKVYPAEHKDAANAIVQGTAGQIVKRAMIQCKKYLEDEGRMLLQIHDEIVFELERNLWKPCTEGLAEIMREAGKPFNTPTSATLYRKDWGHGEEIKI